MEKLGEGVDVNLRHLQSFILRELLVVVKRWDDAAQLIKRMVEPVHSPSLTRVGGHSPLPLNPIDRLVGGGSLSHGGLLFGPGEGAFKATQLPDFERRRREALGRFSVALWAGMA